MFWHNMYNVLLKTNIHHLRKSVLHLLAVWLKFTSKDHYFWVCGAIDMYRWHCPMHCQCSTFYMQTYLLWIYQHMFWKYLSTFILKSLIFTICSAESLLAKWKCAPEQTLIWADHWEPLFPRYSTPILSRGWKCVKKAPHSIWSSH